MGKEQSKSNNSGLATASLTLGILATVLGVVGIGVILGILAIVFGAISIKDNKGKSLAGIITGAIGIVLFVLALIFILVIAPKATEDLQASQRDTQRKNDVSTLVSDITFYMSNYSGQLPDYDFVSGMTYKLTLVEDAIGKTLDGDLIQPTTSTAVYAMGEDCDGNTSARKFSVTVLLENGSKYCQGS